MSILGELLFFLLAPIPFDWAGLSIVGAAERRTDRRLLGDGKVRCAIRAVEGRVLNIGTEVSGGTATLSPGRIHFEPRVGIVGDRRIDVVRIVPAPAGGVSYGLAGGPARAFIVTVAKGDLLWIVPAAIADDVVALVRPVGLDAPSERPPHPPRSTDA